MLEYKVVRVELYERKGLKTTYLENHRQLIDEHASQGWRLAHMVPLAVAMGGVTTQLYFERAKTT